MLALLRKHWLWFLIFLAAGTALRLFFVFKYPLIEGDTFIYGEIARNWLQHGTYAVGEVDALRPTLIRLPGYPALLAACFKLFGVEHYHAVMFVQTVLDLGTALVVSATAFELIAETALRERAAKVCFAAYCLFPYTANYVSQPLAETPTLFTLSLALYLALRALKTSRVRCWISCGVACAATVLLRPDGGLVLISLGAYLMYRWGRYHGDFWRQCARPILVLAACTIIALVPWTVRNHRTFGVLQPLAPANATDPGEFYAAGFVHWTKTWLLEFASVYEIGWSVPGETIDPTLLPGRAFDSPAERQHTLDLVAEYNQTQQVHQDLDIRFEALARKRQHSHPLLYYVGLPLGRVADMWLRPRTDAFPIEIRWWEYNRVPAETAFAASYAALGIAVLSLAFIGYRAATRFQFAPYLGILTSYVLLRTIFLATIATSEPRYTIEAWPMVLVLASLSIAYFSAPTVRRAAM